MRPPGGGGGRKKTASDPVMSVRRRMDAAAEDNAQALRRLEDVPQKRPCSERQGKAQPQGSAPIKRMYDDNHQANHGSKMNPHSVNGCFNPRANTCWCHKQGTRNETTLINHPTGGFLQTKASIHSHIPNLSQQEKGGSKGGGICLFL